MSLLCSDTCRQRSLSFCSIKHSSPMSWSHQAFVSKPVFWAAKAMIKCSREKDRKKDRFFQRLKKRETFLDFNLGFSWVFPHVKFRNPTNGQEICVTWSGYGTWKQATAGTATKMDLLLQKGYLRGSRRCTSVPIDMCWRTDSELRYITYNLRSYIRVENLFIRYMFKKSPDSMHSV